MFGWWFETLVTISKLRVPHSLVNCYTLRSKSTKWHQKVALKKWKLINIIQKYAKYTKRTAHFLRFWTFFRELYFKNNDTVGFGKGTTEVLEFFLYGAEPSLNSANSASSENLRNHWIMNWVQFRVTLCYLCLCGTVVSSLFLLHEIVGSYTEILFDFYRRNPKDEGGGQGTNFSLSVHTQWYSIKY